MWVYFFVLVSGMKKYPMLQGSHGGGSVERRDFFLPSTMLQPGGPGECRLPTGAVVSEATVIPRVITARFIM